MIITNEFFAATVTDWEKWLEDFHQTETEIWLVFYKKHTKKAGLDYESAVQSALCYGWIDSIIQRVNDDYYVRKFTPRKTGSKWSTSNRRRVKQLLADKRMRPDGLKTLEGVNLDEAPPRPGFQPNGEILDFIRQELQQNPPAWNNFQQLPPGQKKLYLGWIMSAKREQTRQKRLAEAVELLKRNQRLGMK